MLFWLTYQLYAEAKVDSGERLEIKTNFGDFTASSYSIIRDSYLLLLDISGLIIYIP